MDALDHTGRTPAEVTSTGASPDLGRFLEALPHQRDQRGEPRPKIDSAKICSHLAVSAMNHRWPVRRRVLVADLARQARPHVLRQRQGAAL